jgi:hypothetical protein
MDSSHFSFGPHVDYAKITRTHNSKIQMSSFFYKRLHNQYFLIILSNKILFERKTTTHAIKTRQKRQLIKLCCAKKICFEKNL